MGSFHDYKKICGLVRDSLPTQFVVESGASALICCELHRSSLPLLVEDCGCHGVAVGKHPSLVALQEHGTVVCHASPGQLAIDNVVRRLLLEFPESFIRQSYARDVAYRQRFMAGNFSSAATYGAGYCYLRMMESLVIGRVARLLGPCPLVADVLRAYLAFGHIDGKRLSFTKVSTGLFHVTNSRDSKGFFSICEYMLAALRMDEYARIGADGIEGLGVTLDNRLGVVVPRELRWFDETPYGWKRSQHSLLNPTSVVSFEFMSARGLHSPERANNLSNWLKMNFNCSVDRLFLTQVELITSASSVLADKGLGDLKSHVRVWAAYGDAVMKVVSAKRVLAQGEPPSSVASAASRQTNDKLVQYANQSGLVSVCGLPGLSNTSRVYATVVEALVGVIFEFCTEESFSRLMASMGICAGPPRIPVYSVYPSAYGRGLNSRQYERALELVAKGELGE